MTQYVVLQQQDGAWGEVTRVEAGSPFSAVRAALRAAYKEEAPEAAAAFSTSPGGTYRAVPVRNWGAPVQAAVDTHVEIKLTQGDSGGSA